MIIQDVFPCHKQAARLWCAPSVPMKARPGNIIDYWKILPITVFVTPQFTLRMMPCFWRIVPAGRNHRTAFSACECGTFCCRRFIISCCRKSTAIQRLSLSQPLCPARPGHLEGSCRLNRNRPKFMKTGHCQKIKEAQLERCEPDKISHSKSRATYRCEDDPCDRLWHQAIQRQSVATTYHSNHSDKTGVLGSQGYFNPI